MPSRAFVVLKLDSGGILQRVSRADAVPGDVRSNGAYGRLR